MKSRQHHRYRCGWLPHAATGCGNKLQLPQPAPNIGIRTPPHGIASNTARKIHRERVAAARASDAVDLSHSSCSGVGSANPAEISAFI